MILVSDGFAKLTGYATDEIVGLNCRVFQGNTIPSLVVTLLKADQCLQFRSMHCSSELLGHS